MAEPILFPATAADTGRNIVEGAEPEPLHGIEFMESFWVIECLDNEFVLASGPFTKSPGDEGIAVFSGDLSAIGRTDVGGVVGLGEFVEPLIIGRDGVLRQQDHDVSGCPIDGEVTGGAVIEFLLWNMMYREAVALQAIRGSIGGTTIDGNFFYGTNVRLLLDGCEDLVQDRHAVPGWDDEADLHRIECSADAGHVDRVHPTMCESVGFRDDLFDGGSPSGMGMRRRPWWFLLRDGRSTCAEIHDRRAFPFLPRSFWMRA